MWKPIDQAPVGDEMFVAQAFLDDYVSKPYCVSQTEIGVFTGWDIFTAPTHFIPIPQYNPTKLEFPKSSSELPLLIGKVIQFTDEIIKSECDFDSGMKARVISAKVKSCGHDEFFELTLDQTEFATDNEKFMIANFTDGEVMLTWKETNSYKMIVTWLFDFNESSFTILGC